MFAAYSQGYRQDDILELVIMADSDKLTYPCGACRQVIMELMNHDAVVTLINLDKKTLTMKVSDLMPGYFGEEYLNV